MELNYHERMYLENKEEIKAKSRAYYWAYREEILLKRKQNYSKLREYHKKYNEQYYKKNNVNRNPTLPKSPRKIIKSENKIIISFN